MTGWVVVTEEGIWTVGELLKGVEQGARFAASLLGKA